MTCCLFNLFLSLIHFLVHLLTSFSRCFSSLGALLLSSMSLRISTSFLKSLQSLLLLLSRLLLHRLHCLHHFLPSFMLLLTCNTIEPASTTQGGSCVVTFNRDAICFQDCCGSIGMFITCPLLQSPRRQSTWFLWMYFQFLLIPLVFLFSSTPSSVSCSTRPLWITMKSSSSFTVLSTGRPRCLPPA